MNTFSKLSLSVLAAAGSTSFAGMVHFQYTGLPSAMSYFNPNFGATIFGNSLDITRGQFDQPALSETPVASVFFMNIVGLNGDFVFLGTGSTTRTAESTQATEIPVPGSPGGVNYFGPQQFFENDTIGLSDNFVDGWRTIHGLNNLTGFPGAFAIDERFAVGVEFELDGQLHYGYAEFKTEYVVFAQQRELSIFPTRWGYNTTAGESARMIPSPGGLALLGFGSVLLTRRRR